MAKKKSANLFAEDDVVRPQNEFDALLGQSGGPSQRGLRPGDRLRGEVLAVSGQEAFVSTGTPVDATMPFALGAGKEAPKVGDMVDVTVVRVRESEILVKAVGSVGEGAEPDDLEDAFDMELPVEGVVLEVVKGGFRVKVHALKAFCPISQMDLRVVNAADYVGKKFSFIITKFDRGRDLVVSRRKVLELERASAEGDFMGQAKIGEIYSGTVFRIEKYGAFIRLENGIEGLIPISEMAWGRIGHPQEVVNLDQAVQVKLLRCEEDGDRLKVSFSLKQGGSSMDPWSSITTDFPVGKQFEGVVEHKEPFGLFVNIAPGVTGLLPRSSWREAVDGNQYEAKRKGDKVKVRIERIDEANHKMSLSVPREDDDESWRDLATSKSTGSFGTMADLLKNVKPNK